MFQSPFGDGRFLTKEIRAVFEDGRVLFQSPFGDGRFLTRVFRRYFPDQDAFQSPFGDGRFLTLRKWAVGPGQSHGFNPLSEMAAF